MRFQKRCQECGKTNARSLKAKYCSDSCRQLAWRRRQGQTGAGSRIAKRPEEVDAPIHLDQSHIVLDGPQTTPPPLPGKVGPAWLERPAARRSTVRSAPADHRLAALRAAYGSRTFSSALFAEGSDQPILFVGQGDSLPADTERKPIGYAQAWETDSEGNERLVGLPRS